MFVEFLYIFYLTSDGLHIFTGIIMVKYQFPGKTSIALLYYNFIFTVKSVGFATPEHTVNSLILCF